MAIYYQKITIVSSRKPAEKNINQELQWFGSSLGLFNLRDKDKSCFRVFIELLKAAKAKHLMSSDEVGFRTGLTRGTVIHHINRLMEAGIVMHERKGYILRADNLKGLIDEMEKASKRAYNELRLVAEEIDEKLGL